VVSKLVETARTEGPGHKYLIQHSPGSGKSNSIAWVAHQLSSLHNASGNKQFDSVIIVTIQTFPYVLKAIENSVSLKERNYVVIADEAHSSQTGSTARQLKEVLMVDSTEEELTTEDILDAAVASRRASSNLSYLAFTATPKTKTLELFGRLPNPNEAPSNLYASMSLCPR